MALNFFRMQPQRPEPAAEPTDRLLAAILKRREEAKKQAEAESAHRQRMEYAQLQYGQTPEQMAKDKYEFDAGQSLKNRELDIRQGADQRKAMSGLPALQGTLNDPAKAQAHALSMGITDLKQKPLTDGQAAIGDFFQDMEGLDPAQAKADNFDSSKSMPNKFGFSLGGQEMELEASPPTESEDWARSAQALRSIGASASDQGLKTTAEAFATAVEAGQLKPRDAFTRLSAMQGQYRGQDKAAERRAKGKGTGSTTSGKGSLPFDKEARSVITGYLNSQGYKKAQEELESADAVLQNLESGNPALQRQALGLIAKEGAGPGTVQQSERDEFVNNVGGKWEGIKKKINEWVAGGAPPDDQIQIFVDAWKKTITARKQRKMREVQQGARSAFERHPNPSMRRYADWGANWIAGGGTEAAATPEEAPATQQTAQPRKPANVVDAMTQRRRGKIDADDEDFIQGAGL